MDKPLSECKKNNLKKSQRRQSDFYPGIAIHTHDTFGPESIQFTEIFGRNCSLKRLSEFSLGTELLPPLELVNTNSISCVLLTGLCPDWESWDPRKPVDNAREAMQQADDWLGVPQVRVQDARPTALFPPMPCECLVVLQAV